MKPDGRRLEGERAAVICSPVLADPWRYLEHDELIRYHQTSHHRDHISTLEQKGGMVSVGRSQHGLLIWLIKRFILSFPLPPSGSNETEIKDPDQI